MMFIAACQKKKKLLSEFSKSVSKVGNLTVLWWSYDSELNVVVTEHS